MLKTPFLLVAISAGTGTGTRSDKGSGTDDGRLEEAESSSPSLEVVHMKLKAPEPVSCIVKPVLYSAALSTQALEQEDPKGATSVT